MGRMYSQGAAPVIVVGQRSLPWWLRYAPARICYMDDFEGVLKWKQNAGTVTKDSSVNVFEGSNALKLVTGAVAGNYAIAKLFLPMLVKAKIALQLRWSSCPTFDVDLRSFTARIYNYDGTYFDQLELRYLKNLSGYQNKWQYFGPGGSFLDLPGGGQDLRLCDPYNHYLRVVWDLSTRPAKLTEFESNTLLLRPANVQGYYTGSATPPSASIELECMTDVASSVNAYVDTLCLSDQEP